MEESTSSRSVAPPRRPQHDYLLSSNSQFPNRMSLQRSNASHGLSHHRVGPYDHNPNQTLRSHHYSGNYRDSTVPISHQTGTSNTTSHHPIDLDENAYSNVSSLPNPRSSTSTRQNIGKNVNASKDKSTNNNRINRSLGGFIASESHGLHTHLHPYLHSVHAHSGASDNGGGPPFIMHGGQELLSQPQGLMSALRTLRLQGQRFIDILVGRQHKTQELTPPPAVSRIIVILPILYFIIRIFFSSSVDSMTQLQEFEWTLNPAVNNRKCVLNLFIEKQKPDEFNPDFVPAVIPKKGRKRRLTPVTPKMQPGSYRTVGQTKVIRRFISSVADSFRPNSMVQQHLIFAGTRDGGHLAENALSYWPPRGKYRTQVYVLADDISEAAVQKREKAMNRRKLMALDPKELENIALGYGPLGDIEERFQNHVKAMSIHIYDSRGQMAGLLPSNFDDDDVIALHEEEMFGEDFDDDIISHLPVDEIDDDAVLSSGGTDYISLKKLLAPHLERDESGETMSDTEHIIPYLHVDGIDAARQFEILASARPLLLDKTIVSVVVEHSPNMDIYQLIDFFTSVHYKTFFLGLRTIARIDHMCPEILDQVINHPFITPEHPSNVLRQFSQLLGIVGPDEEPQFVHPHDENQLKFPPFFVAFPRGRTSQEEMTIQHNYDLFGGMSAGGTIKTANDRE